MSNHLVHTKRTHSTFGDDRFGQAAERFARFFGTAKFILGQSILIVVWIALNVTLVHAGLAWDVYPFILLNLLFSTQAAYAAPLILLAQTRQADRDKVLAEAQADHSEKLAVAQRDLLVANTQLTEEVARLTRELHQHQMGNGVKAAHESLKLSD